MMDANPWSYAGWSITEQGVYLRTYGQARAEARARDAGTVFGGPRPLPPKDSIEQSKRGPLAQPALVRPGDRAIYMVNKNKPFIPMRRPRGIGSIHFSLGLSETVILSQFFTEADLAAIADIGLTATATLDLTQLLTATAALGISESVALDLTQQLNTSPALGVTEMVTLDLTQLLSVTSALGISQTVALQLERDLAASASLGISEAVALQLERDLAASAALGISETAVLTVDNQRVTSDNTVRVTSDGTTRAIKP